MASPDRWMMGIGAALALLVTRSIVWPWHAAPEPSPGAWSSLVAHAEVDSEAFGDTTLLTAVIEAGRSTAEPNVAVQTLMKWSEARGAVVPAPCDVPPAELAETVTRMLDGTSTRSLAVAKATQRLSHLLRTSGTREGYVAGTAVFEALRALVRRRDLETGNDLDTQIDVDEFPAMFAQASICTDRKYATDDDHMHWQSATSDGLQGRLAVPWHARHFVNVARERQMFRAWRGGILARCLPSRSQRVGFYACAQTELAKDPLPLSVAVRTESFPLPPQLWPTDTHDEDDDDSDD